MDYRIILSKIIALIYRSRLIGIYDHDDLTRSILNRIKTEHNNTSLNGLNYIDKLKHFCIELLEIREPFELSPIKQRLSLILENDTSLLNSILENISSDFDDASNKRIITSSVKLLNNYYKEADVDELIARAHYDIRFNRSKIANFNDYIRGLIANIEPLTNATTKIKDPAVVDEVDFENPENVSETFKKVKSQNNNQSIFKTGWHAMNRLMQGGIRAGEFVSIGALQHKYKTGESLSLFCQIPRHNKPFPLKDPSKKPLLLRISFEDSLTNNFQFMYQYLKVHEHLETYIETVGKENINKQEMFNFIGTAMKLEESNMNTLSEEELSKYIIEKLTATGFYIKMMRVDPSQWTYMSVINKIMELEANGYEVQLLMLDYITLLPTTGCTVGPAGFDRKDLLRRIRNFCSARGIATVSPLQLSSEAKQLIRNGVPEHQFVNEVAEKGYYDGSKSIDQDIDLELFIHLFSHQRKKYLAVRRGKHRVPTVIEDEDKYFMHRFPGLNIPILEDIMMDDTSFKKIPREATDSDKILSEIL